MDNRFEQVIQQFPPWFLSISASVPIQVRGMLTEVCLFTGQPVFWRCGQTGSTYDTKPISQQELQEIFTCFCHGSVHCYERDIAQGFITLNGGHRAGLCGTFLWRNGQVSGLRDISSITLRVAQQVKGCARELYRLVGKSNFLLAGAPGTGKTTLLRDYVRIACGGNSPPSEVAVVLDERSELSAFDLGSTAHILKGLPKTQAIRQALRTLSPQLIVSDEIDSAEEAELLCQSLNSGCRFVGSIHADNWDSLLKKKQFQTFQEQGVLDAVVFLEGLGRIKEIREV